MVNDTIVSLTDPAFRDELSDLVREGARRIVAQAVEAEYAEWRSRDWQGHEFVYLWADGIHTNVRAEKRRCILLLVGCDVHGRKHFLAIEDSFRESTES